MFFGAQSDAEAEEVRPARGNGQRRDLGALALHDGDEPICSLPKVMARDKIGSFMEASDCEVWLNRWIQNYVNPMDGAGQEAAQNTRCERRRSRSRKSQGGPVPTMPWLISGLGCRWRS